MNEIFRNISESYYVFFHEDKDIIFSWKGHNFIFVYDLEGDLLDEYELKLPKKNIREFIELTVLEIIKRNY